MLQLVNVSKSFGGNQVFSEFSLNIPSGEIVSMVGPNGCGKTTLLNLIAGILQPDAGHILRNGINVDTVKKGYVLQDYRNSLFPWMNVQQNLCFPNFVKKDDIIHTLPVMDALLEKFKASLPLQSYPYQLSGGQQQLIAIIRSLIIRPDIFLLDEPFSSLDYQTTLGMIELCTQILNQEKVTTVFISHDIDEAILFSTTIIVLGNKPTQVVGTYRNEAPYPRTLEMTATPEFMHIKQGVIRSFKKVIVNN